MPESDKKGLTVKIDASLHAEVKRFIEDQGMTMAEFVSKALDDELHPKIQITEGKNMGNMRTMAFQVPEELFQQIKDYLNRHHMTQKQFVLGLIETELNRDMELQNGVREDQPAEQEDEYDEYEETDSEDMEDFEDEEFSEEYDDSEDEDDDELYDDDPEDDEDMDEDEDIDEDESNDESMYMEM